MKSFRFGISIILLLLCVKNNLVIASCLQATTFKHSFMLNHYESKFYNFE